MSSLEGKLHHFCVWWYYIKPQCYLNLQRIGGKFLSKQKEEAFSGFFQKEV